MFDTPSGVGVGTDLSTGILQRGVALSLCTLGPANVDLQTDPKEIRKEVILNNMNNPTRRDVL